MVVKPLRDGPGLYSLLHAFPSLCSAPTLPCLRSGRTSSPYQTALREPPAQRRLLPSCPSPPGPQSLASAPSCPCPPLWAFVSGLFWLPMPAFLSLSSLGRSSLLRMGFLWVRRAGAALRAGVWAHCGGFSLQLPGSRVWAQ